MSTISIRLNKELEEQLNSILKSSHKSKNSFIKEAIANRIEIELKLQQYEEQLYLEHAEKTIQEYKNSLQNGTAEFTPEDQVWKDLESEQ